GVRGGPASSLPICRTVAQAQSVAINAHVVKERPARPTLDCAAVTERAGGFALHECIWSSRAVAGGKIMATMLGEAPEKQSLLAHREKRVPPITAVLRNRRERKTI